MNTMKCRIQEHGGVVEDSLTARTTHLVATQDAVGDVARQMAHCPADRCACSNTPAGRAIWVRRDSCPFSDACSRMRPLLHG